MGGKIIMMNQGLKQTEGKFKLEGKVSRIDGDGAFRQDTQDNQNNRNYGRTFRALRFGVKTSPTNEITVGTFDYEPEQVFLWNSEKRQADPEYRGDRVPYGTWLEQKDDLNAQGYTVLQSRVGFERDDEGNLKTEGLPRYVSSQLIYDNIDNGDSVVIEGEVRYTRSTNRSGQDVLYTNYTIERLFKIEDIDFEAKDFEEVTYFEQEMVFVDADVDKQDKKVYVTGRTIDYREQFVDSQFVVDFSDGEGGNDEDMVKLANAFDKRFNFGDVINVFGDTTRRVVVEEVEDELSEEDNLLASLGGRSRPSYAPGRQTSRTYVEEMKIYGVDGWEKGVYTDEDFIQDGLIQEEPKKKDGGLDLGGKKKPKSDNPFDIGEDDVGTISDEDLPF